MQSKISLTTITADEKIKYYLLTETEALHEITKAAKDVNEILNLPSTTLVRLILNNFHWDQDTLTEKFFTDAEILFKELNVANPYLSPSLQSNPLSPGHAPERDPMLAAVEQMATDNTNKTCRTCYSEKPSGEFYALRCRHQHCLTCWHSYLEANIGQHGCLRPIYCLSRCIEVIDDEKILELLSNDQNLCDRYRKNLVQAFVEANRLTQWCPGNGCVTIVKLNTYSANRAHLIECDNCKTSFCFQCSKPWHEPIQCSLLAKWEQKNCNESMNGTWVIANTKDCPKCHSAIEKNGGCNHMTCRKPGCGYEFCWLCFGDWKSHATQQCNVYHAQATEEAQASAREILKRYIHYFTRYQAHSQSLEFESKLKEKVEERQKEMEVRAMTYADRQAPGKAFEVLQQCRRTLKYTYPFAFYLERNNESIMFEDNQAHLEQTTEILSEFLEREFDGQHETVLKLKDTTNFCEQRRKILVKDCKDGYSKQRWIGLDPY
ncbi:unnamed protein product [Rotaria socialis]|uniref:RBR-type E3 ubiquitin transferase n=1 Tax=Rotaria socialis TaxID=392032 RepID=A0A817MWB6_9BILA|nr:unnamed protein product [Rotaria socialis]CAF3332515.1 unnamed protein product [Rotaria socialis]CAF3726753.1 unnamed protein product [Rotaria socialis]CAF4168792.1 unnamed protein product [Rotaria socialis]CAF4229049.1 unnamed protein product [Rotaria socialis]